jgi:hypothetical protein
MDVAAGDDDVERRPEHVRVLVPDVQLVRPREHGSHSSATLVIKRHILPLQRKRGQSHLTASCVKAKNSQTCGPVRVASSGCWSMPIALPYLSHASIQMDMVVIAFTEAAGKPLTLLAFMQSCAGRTVRAVVGKMATPLIRA